MSSNGHKKIENLIIEQECIKYLINEEDKTAGVIGCCDEIWSTLFIPCYINYQSNKYYVTSILKNAFKSRAIKSIEIAEDSKLQTIEENAFSLTPIQSLTIPSEVTDLRDGWCNFTNELTTIKMSPSNPQYCCLDEKMIIGKSSIENKNYDCLIFCARNIKSITIPDSIKYICSYAFEKSSIESIIIPPEVIRIEKCAFYNCLNLKRIEFTKDSKLQTIEEDALSLSPIESISIPSEVTDLKDGWCICTQELTKVSVSSSNRRYCCIDEKMIIGKSSIESTNYDCLVFCVRNIKNITIPNYIKYICPYAFEKSLIESIIISPEVIMIGRNAFSDCENLQQIEFTKDSKLQTIEEDAFGSTLIERISIPSEVTDLKDGWCSRTHKLTKISVSPSNPRYCCLDEKMIIGKSSIESTNYDCLVFCVRNIKNIIIPNFITSICPYAFSESSIESITIPFKITRIGESAFLDCKQLQQIEFAENSELQFIEKTAFLESSIERIKIPPEVVMIEKGAFYGCEELKEVEFSKDSKLQFIGKAAFYESSVERITIPSEVISIGKYAFFGCEKLQQVEFAKDSKLEVIEKSSFEKTSIEEIIIPPDVVKIGKYAFSDCQNLQQIEFAKNTKLQLIEKFAFHRTSIESIIIPSEVIKIEEGAFKWCPLSQEIEFAKDSKLQIIENEVFQYTIIDSITIPSSVMRIGDSAFDSCENLQIIEFTENSKLQTIGEDVFYLAPIESLSIPSELIDLKDGWCSCTEKLTKISVSSSNPRYFCLDEKMIIGKSSIESTIYDYLVFCVRNIQRIIIPDYITYICPHAFSESLIKSINIPSNVTKIGKNCFDKCVELNKIDFTKDSKLQIIQESAFSFTLIESITIPSEVTKIEKSSFDGCLKLLIIEFNENSLIDLIDANLFGLPKNSILMISGHLNNHINH